MCCDSVRPWLGAFFDGEVSRIRGWRIRRHLRHCAACAREVEALGALTAGLRQADVAPAPSAPVAPSNRPLPRVLRRAAAVSAVTVAAVAVFLMDRSRSYGDPLERAIATLANAPAWGSSHVVVRNRAGERVREQWVILPGTLRDEQFTGGRSTGWTVQFGGRTRHYHAARNRVYVASGNLYLPEAHGVGMFHGPINALRRLLPAVEKRGGVTVTERETTTPEGRREREYVIAIDVSRHYRDDLRLRDTRTVRHVVRVDAASGRLVRWEDPQSELIYEVDRYNEPVPVELINPQSPEGAQTVEVQDWWAERSSRTAGTDATAHHTVTVHAVDAAANGDLWLTISRRNPRPAARISHWPSRGMLAYDERGRAYVQFVTLGNGNWPKHVSLLGFTPVKPRTAGEPRPRRLTVHLLPEHRPHSQPADHRRERVEVRGLPVPAPADWEAPPLNLLHLLRRKTGDAAWMSPRRGEARRAYRADNPCGALD